MNCNLRLWASIKQISIKGDVPANIVKVTSIRDHVFVLSEDRTLYSGVINLDASCVSFTQCSDINVLDIDCDDNDLFTVNTHGEVHVRNSDLAIINEIALCEESKCVHGKGVKSKIPVQRIFINKFGQLFITESGQLWAAGHMPQIGVDSHVPQKVIFFDGRYTYAAAVGCDFAIAVVSKNIKHEESDSDNADDNAFSPSCSQCLSASRQTSPLSQTSLSESCQLGLKIHNSYDIETTSTSSKNDSSNSGESNRLLGSDSLNEDTSKLGKNIIVRNTEAAKQFLTRQISWMSSAGEEYLAECTEKPSRIIKENVTNMASLVYEGVKTVGDKVATLSRHVSGSSDCNGVLESEEHLAITRPASKEELLWSLSQGTSEHDLSVQDMVDRKNMLLTVGSNILNREVWTWGNVMHGQLGIGDSIRRERPMIITKLSNIGVCTVSVGDHHAAVLTIDGRAFIWGQNDCSQVTYDTKQDQSSPKAFIISPKERIKDISCGHYNTVILSCNLHLFYLGLDAPNLSMLYSPQLPRNTVQKSPIIKDVLTDDKYSILNELDGENDFIVALVSKEQIVLEEMLLTHSVLIKPLLKKISSLNDTAQYENLCEGFLNMLNISAANIKSILEFRNRLISSFDIVMFKCTNEYISVYKKYLLSLYNVICVDGFKSLLKVLDIPQSLYKLRPNVQKKDRNSEEQIISSLLLLPLNNLKNYADMIDAFSEYLDNDNLRELFHIWSEFIEEQNRKYKEAEETRQFWLSHGKLLESLKTPNRRWIRDSFKHPIYLRHSSRFSSHNFILLSDTFVHICNSSLTVHNLKTLWVEPIPDEMTEYHQLSLKMPEDSLILYTTTAEEKIEWFHILQNAIKKALSKMDALQPPVIRSASYTFTKAGFFKDSTYTGRWLDGKMHGNGKLEWNDEKVYAGQFCNHQICGYGRMDIPNVGTYEGQWKDNQQNGLGVLNYYNKDVYKGYFKDGLPHGHGLLSKGKFNSSMALVYIGEWVLGLKNGYGVLDDIIAGEKCFGNWIDDKKQGSGIVVTSDGVYYEGSFTQDVLTGCGLMICEDGTSYEGEFKGAGILNGKGKLTLQSGEVIEGHLTGNWNEGIKIVNATFHRTVHREENLNTCLKSFGKICCPVSVKWKALFLHCHQVLGLTENNFDKKISTKRIWQNVAVALTSAHLYTLRRNKGETYLEDSLNKLDIIPPYGSDNLDAGTFKEVKDYLTKAFDSQFHPLGSLLNDLCTAYMISYGGIFAHPLLVTHAVDELHSITERIYEVVRLLFPALPPYGVEYLIKNDAKDEIVSSQTLLYPIILPKVYSSLFILFNSKNKQQESQYEKRLFEWNKHPDHALIAFLAADCTIFNLETINSLHNNNHLLTEAIETLQQLKTTFLPNEKLYIVLETAGKLNDAIHKCLGENDSFGADTLLPLFLYVVVRARVLQLGSELDFIENFIEANLKQGEMGFMLATLRACYEQILHEKTSIA